jgi:nucleoside-diphosphate-sugar epimerase
MANLNKILVIGGSGFVGTRLIKRLVDINSCSVGIFDKVCSAIFPRLTTIGDVRSLSDLQLSLPNYSVIINLAAEHRDDVKPANLYSEVNIQGAKNICAVACEANIKKIIFTSTVAVYGFAPIGTDESGAINPFNEYGRTKYEAEKVYRDWQLADPLSRVLVILRPTVIFGEQNRGNVFNLLRSIASGSFLMIGSGKNRKSISYF